MNDTQRLNWLERNPERLLVHRSETTRFSILLELGKPSLDPMKWTDPKYSEVYDTLRDALDEGMKKIL